MLYKKRALSLLLVLTCVNLISAAEIALTPADIENYLSKAKVDGLLKKQPSKFVETNDALVKDLQTASIATYFDCQTLVGYNFLNTALSLPVSPKSDCGVVANRQALIMQLVNDPVLKKMVDDYLLLAKNAEKVVIELFGMQFVNSACPEKMGLDQLKARNDPSYQYLKSLLTSAKGKIALNTVNTFSLAVCAYMIRKSSLGMQEFYKAAKTANMSSFQITKGMAAMSLSPIIYTGLGSVVLYGLGKDYLKAAKKRNKIHGLSEFVIVAEEFEELCVKNGIKTQFKISDIIDEVSLNIIKELKKSRYSQKTAYFFMAPYVDEFLYDLYDKDGGFGRIFASLAEVDACNAIATKMLANQAGKNQFCFAKYLDQVKPEVKTIDTWNILVGEQKAVANSLHETKNILLSGVNAGGKTTYTRSILQNIVLAQTFGVAAASSFEFTPFDVVGSYLNISDDLIAGNSLFVSEVKRAQEIKAKIDAILGTDLKYFFALDELFTGTSAEAGEQCACDFVSRIANSDNAMFIYPTHFDKLKHLGDQHVNCANYKVDTAAKLSDGSLVYPFTISQGASYDNIAMDIAINANLFN